MSRPTFDLVVFDWDGTLADSAAAIVSSLQHAARSAGLEPRSAAAIRRIIGLGLAEALDGLYPGLEREATARLAEAYRAHYLATPGQSAALFAGAAAVVEDLARAGYLLAVATGKSRAGLARALEQTGLGRHMDASRCADEAPSKPHPQMLLEIMEELGVEASRTVVVGDTEHDLGMAHNAGVAAIAVTYGAHEPERLMAWRPLACLDEIAALPEALRSDTPGETIWRAPR